MDRLSTKKTLAELLTLPAYKVIVLTGEWGVGKTHLWRELADEQGIKHGYFSLFGIRDSAEVSKGLAISLARIGTGDASKLRKAWDAISGALANALDKGADAGGLVGASLGVLNDIASANVLEGLLRGETVVLDDIERSASELTMDVLLGTIDQLRQLDCKVVLILNDAKLDQRETTWRNFYEKVVDIQLCLRSSPADAIDAVLHTAPMETRTAIRNAWIRSDSRNIRLAERAIRAVATIVPNPDTFPLVASQLIGDIVYLTIAEFRGYDSESDATDVLRAVTTAGFTNDIEKRTKIEKVRAATKADFSVYRDFQKAVIEFLRTGLIARDEWHQLLRSANEDVRLGAVAQQLQDWISAALWDPTVSDTSLKLKAEQQYPEVWRLHPAYAQSYIFALKEIGAEGLVDDFVSAWRDGVLRERKLYSKKLIFEPIEPLDARINATVDRVAAMTRSFPKLGEALFRRISLREFLELDSNAISAAKVDDWERYLTQATSRENLDLVHGLLRDGGTDILDGIQTLREALNRICKTMPTSRLARIIRNRSLIPNPDNAYAPPNE